MSDMQERGTGSTIAKRGLSAMLRLLFASAVGIAAAVLIGYVGAAVMATELGRVWLAAAAILVTLAIVAESTSIFGRLRHA